MVDYFLINILDKKEILTLLKAPGTGYFSISLKVLKNLLEEISKNLASDKKVPNKDIFSTAEGKNKGLDEEVIDNDNNAIKGILKIKDDLKNLNLSVTVLTVKTDSFI